MNFYWFKRLMLPVNVGNREFIWRRVFGIRIGSWFIGAIEGEEAGAEE